MNPGRVLTEEEEANFTPAEEFSRGLRRIGNGAYRTAYWIDDSTVRKIANGTPPRPESKRQNDTEWMICRIDEAERWVPKPYRISNDSVWLETELCLVVKSDAALCGWCRDLGYEPVYEWDISQELTELACDIASPPPPDRSEDERAALYYEKIVRNSRSSELREALTVLSRLGADILDVGVGNVGWNQSGRPVFLDLG